MDGQDQTDSASEAEINPNTSVSVDTALQTALGAIGSWRDLDWEETVEALDRIRHESQPTQPIEL